MMLSGVVPPGATETLRVAVLEPAAFRTVSVTVKLPAAAKTWLGFWSELGAPSPKAHDHDVGGPVDASVN